MKADVLGLASHLRVMVAQDDSKPARLTNRAAARPSRLTWARPNRIPTFLFSDRGCTCAHGMPWVPWVLVFLATCRLLNWSGRQYETSYGDPYGQ